MIKNNKDFFQLIDEIILKFEQSNHQQNADRLKRALHLSSLPSEIFGELKLALQDILCNQADYDEITKSMLIEAGACIKKTLR